MDKHLASVNEGKKPFECEKCDYSFSLKGSLNQHVSLVHKGKNNTNVEFCDLTSLRGLIPMIMLLLFMKERNHSNVLLMITAVH